MPTLNEYFSLSVAHFARWITLVHKTVDENFHERVPRSIIRFRDKEYALAAFTSQPYFDYPKRYVTVAISAEYFS